MLEIGILILVWRLWLSAMVWEIATNLHIVISNQQKIVDNQMILMKEDS